MIYILNNFKLTVVTLLLFLVVTENGFSQNPDQNKEKTIVEIKPEFPGGDAEMYKFIFTTIEYPTDAKELKKEGIVRVTFLVQADGVVDTSSVEVVKSLFPSCDDEAIRVIKQFPKWSPGIRSNGEAEKVRIVLPVFFKLPKEKKRKKHKKKSE